MQGKSWNSGEMTITNIVCSAPTTLLQAEFARNRAAYGVPMGPGFSLLGRAALRGTPTAG